jgi:hypothetical protein
MLRYYGIYANNINKKLEDIEGYTWAKAIEHSFENKPEVCPECSSIMVKDIVYSFQADKEIKKLVKTHGIVKGYFISYKGSQPP